MVAFKTLTAYPVKPQSRGASPCVCHVHLYIDGLGCAPLPAVENISRWKPFGPLSPEFEVAPVPEFRHTYALRCVIGSVRFAIRDDAGAVTYSDELRYRST